MSETADLGLFDGVLARGGSAQAVSDRAWLQAMLDVEGGAGPRRGPRGLLRRRGRGRAIARACRADAVRPRGDRGRAAKSGNPVIPLVRALTGAVESASGRGPRPRGATSQDVLDTAAMLVAHRALDPLLDDLAGAADAAAALATAHRSTLMAGRTLLQQALPITFGARRPPVGWSDSTTRRATRPESGGPGWRSSSGAARNAGVAGIGRPGVSSLPGRRAGAREPTCRGTPTARGSASWRAPWGSRPGRSENPRGT